MPDTDINVDATRQIATDLANPAVPAWDDATQYNLTDPERLVFACRDLGWSADVPADGGVETATLDAARALVRLLPTIQGAVPQAHVPPELGWATVAQWFGALGYGYWAPIVETLFQVVPQSVACELFNPAASYTEWRETMLAFRRVNPLGFGTPAVPCAQLARMTGRGAEAFPYTWQSLAVAWHIVRHARRSDQYGLVVTHNTRVTAFQFREGDTSLAPTPAVLQRILTALDLPLPGLAKNQHPLGVAANQLLSRMSLSTLLPRRSLSDLPCAVLAGPWSVYAPVAETHRWFQHGLTLDGVCVANAGRVLAARDTVMAPDDALGFDWNPHVLTADTLRDRDQWLESVPTHYTAVQSPVDVWREYCPNVSVSGPEHAAMLDAVVVASLIRPLVPALRQEFPLVCLLAGDPTAEGSSNGGKTAATTALIGAMAPGTPTVVQPASTSTVERRSFTVLLARHGTLGLDEWQLPIDTDHVLSRAKLQSLCTGKGVSFGLVLDNQPRLLYLRTSLVINAKALRLPIDVTNRALFAWVEPLTAAQRANGRAFADIMSGAASVRIRLAAIALLEAHADTLMPTGAVATAADSSRFGCHRYLAAKLLRIRDASITDDTEAFRRIDAAHRALANEYHSHLSQATSSGLMAELETGHMPANAPPEEIFDGLTADTAAGIAARAGAAPISAGDLLSAACWRQQAADPTASISTNVARLLNDNRVSELKPRVLTRRFAADLMRLMPEPCSTWPLPGAAGLAGWHLRRSASLDGRCLFQLQSANPADATPKE